MKKFFTLLTAFITMLSFAACGEDAATTGSTGDGDKDVTTSTTVSSEPDPDFESEAPAEFSSEPTASVPAAVDAPDESEWRAMATEFDGFCNEYIAWKGTAGAGAETPLELSKKGNEIARKLEKVVDELNAAGKESEANELTKIIMQSIMKIYGV